MYAANPMELTRMGCRQKLRWRICIVDIGLSDLKGAARGDALWLKKGSLGETDRKGGTPCDEP